MAVNSSTGGGGATGGAIRAGGAFVELFTKDRITPTLDAIKKRFANFGAGIAKIGAISGAAGLALAAPLTALFKGGTDRAGQIKDLADSFGIAEESASRLGYAFEVAGLSIEDTTGALFKFAQKLPDGADLEKSFVDAMKSIADIENPVQRSKAAFDAFGKSGVKMLAVMGDIDGLLGDAPIIGKAQIVAAEQFQQSVAKVSIALKSGLLPLLEYLAPAAGNVAVFARENAHLLLTAAAVSAGLIGLSFALSTIGTIAGTVAAALGLVSTVIGFALFTKVGLLTTGLVALTTWWATSTEGGKRAASSWLTAFGGMQTAWDTSIGAIIGDLKDGQFERAFQTAILAIRSAWAEAMVAITQTKIEFQNTELGKWVQHGIDGMRTMLGLLEKLKPEIDVTGGGGPGAKPDPRLEALNAMSYWERNALGWQVIWTRITKGNEAAVKQGEAILGVYQEMQEHNRKEQNAELEASRETARKAADDLAEASRRAPPWVTGQGPGYTPGQESRVSQMQSAVGAARGAFQGPLAQMLGGNDSPMVAQQKKALAVHLAALAEIKKANENAQKLNSILMNNFMYR